MKSLFILSIAVLCAATLRSQPDTNYATVAVSAEWMPDGKSLLIAVVRYHKTDQKTGYTSKVFRYDIASKQTTALFDNAGNLAPAPDGKTIGFMKRDVKKRTDIYTFDLNTKRESLLYSDTSSKNSLGWSPDGKNLVYNISHNGVGQHSTIDVCVLNIATKKVRQVTQSDKDKCYDPNWSPDGKKIVYYLEKGDSHDQIWLTDLEGSFHTNLTNDTTTHNYFASWFDQKTILYTQSPETIMLMNVDGTGRRKVEGLSSEQVKYNPVAGKFLYVDNETGNNVTLFDWKLKQKTIVLDGTKMTDKF